MGVFYQVIVYFDLDREREAEASRLTLRVQLMQITINGVASRN